METIIKKAISDTIFECFKMCKTTIVFNLKMETESKNKNFGLKMTVKNILKFLHTGKGIPGIHFSLLHKRKDFCAKLKIQ